MDITLDTKLVKDINGLCYIRSYQRGYRWGEDEVVRLLDDIYTNGAKDYYLQPIVVRREQGSYELIDGQQRITTLFLIYKYMHDVSGGFLNKPRFSLTYQTREKTSDILADVDLERKEENIDYWFICNAYETISKWFSTEDKQDIKSVLTDINTYFDKYVRVIWYEVDANQDANALFTRLNIGKIPLTSAELVKAMFLCRTRDELLNENISNINPQFSLEKREEVSLLWDNIEKELHNDSLWYFLTNGDNQSYQTRIDLVLDMITKKPIDSKDKYFTFFEIDKMQKEEGLDGLWLKIQHTFLTIKDWYENHECYHKIGYLITSRKCTLLEIYELYTDQTKSTFIESLDNIIKESIYISSNYGELSYENSTDYSNIRRLLLLFNVEAVRQNGESTLWFPFDKFKFNNGERVGWSLEHIHAQQSEGMSTMEAWKKWLELHLESVARIAADNETLISSIETAISKERLERNEFEDLQQRVFTDLYKNSSTEYLHSIANLALLNSNDNAALSNSTFDVKRNELIKMDKTGQYIPFCTKMVFLKYYSFSDPAGNQLYFWGQADRVAYTNAINEVLKDYLSEPIVIEKEVL